MPVTVTISRGTPLPWPVGLAFTVVGAALVIFGFAIVGPIEVPGEDTFSFGVLDLVAVLIVVPAWWWFLRSLLGRSRVRHAATVGVPHELAEPPSGHDPAVISAVVGNGTPAPEAVAATVLGLALQKEIDIQEHGDRVVITVPPDATARTRTDAAVLAGLRDRASDDGVVTGPPIWGDELPGWHDYVHDARARAVAAGLVETRIPFVSFMIVCIVTATALALVFFWYIVSFVGFILLANGVPHLVARASGYRLSAAGIAARARWTAFGRYLHEHESLRDVGPAGVVVWGPYLVYGVLVGEGEKAARMLTPG